MERLGDILARYTTPTVISRASSDTSSDTDTAPKCAQCGGAGWLYYNVPLDDPNYGHIYPCDCTAGRLREQRRQRLRDKSGLRALSRMTFGSFEFRETELPEEHSQNLEKVWDAVCAYAYKPWPQGWLLLYGTYGCGKTHLAAAAVNYRISELERPAMFVVVPDFLDYLRSTFKPDAGNFDEYFRSVKEIEFLVLDDLGAENSTPWVNETLFELVNYRYNNEMPTIFTSNAEPEALDPRIRSRMLDNSFTERWVIQAPDYRLTARSAASSLLLAQGNADPPAELVETAAAPRRGRRKA